MAHKSGPISHAVMGFIRLGHAIELVRSREFSEKPLGVCSFRANPHVASQPTTTKPTAGTHPSVSFRGFATADDEPDRNPNCRW